MKRKDYERPTAFVVELQQNHLMTGTQIRGAGVQNYKWNNVEEE
jgi:hypothetical protein